MRDLWRDLQFTWRQLRRAPAFAAAVVATLAIGVGANTGIFSIINGFLRPLPVPNADRIVILAATFPSDDAGFRYRFSYPALVDYRAQMSVFSDLVAFDTRIGGMTVDGKTQQFLYQAVTGNFFTGLGLTPSEGRLFRPGEGDALGAEPTAVLARGYWLRRFGGRTSVIGTLVRVDGRAVRVVGVAPADFRGLYPEVEMDGFVSLSTLAERVKDSSGIFDRRDVSYLTMVGRLKTGVSISDAQKDANRVAARLAVEHPATEKDMTVRVIPEPLARPIPLRFFSNVTPVIRGLQFLLATIVLLLACLNVTNLLLVRASARERELATRAALGAGRGQLIRLLLVESSVLTILGAAGGLVLGRTLSLMLTHSFTIAIDLSVGLDAHFDWRVFSYAFVVAAVTAGLVGLIPAWRASRPNVTAFLHEGGRGGTGGARRQRVRRVLVVAQVAGSLVLLVMAGLFVRNLQLAERINLGFDPDHLLTLRLDPGEVGYSVDRTETFYKELERRVRGIAGVDHAAFAFGVPMGYLMAFGSCPIEREGAPVTDKASQSNVAYNSVGTDYFETLKLPLVRGRPFDDRDVAGSLPVAVVNETLAARLWPGQNPIGRRLKAICQSPDTLFEVVGVARDSKYIAVFEQSLPYLYLPIVQTQPSLRTLQVRSAVPPDELRARVQHEIDAIDPEIPIADVRTMRAAIDGSIGYVLFHIGATQALALGTLGLLLAMVGLYGVVSYGASQRVREIGIRLALGAVPRDIQRLIAGQGVGLIAAGVVLGLVVSAVVASFVTRVLVLGSVWDPVAFGVMTAVLVAVGSVACYLPARRAMRADPATALRHE